ncbi:MAG: response regulator [Ignavibacteria bacterium]|jgi:DNA-binding response OmpR family regulator|nr:response regulator [Ignavibacteria bacterium]HEX2960418.1 response regulator [Ignavibacteriales bacterium]MCU7498338.1 response regulator [Ignavibacteria bacterium]MCU7512691.1 response regulator [Ignavibacteria bacterium]MCU7520232.1 response regulator [Ignavibacteria bacterium]
MSVREDFDSVSQEETIITKEVSKGNTGKTVSVEGVQGKPNVLVVDDDKKILEAFKYLMESENCNMIGACDVDEVMQKIQDVHLDLIITDFMLESKSSIELFTLIRKSQPEVPVVVMTGYPELISEKDVKMFGGNYLLTKPLELGRLRDVIRTCCNPLKIVSY